MSRPGGSRPGPPLLPLNLGSKGRPGGAPGTLLFITQTDVTCNESKQLTVSCRNTARPPPSPCRQRQNSACDVVLSALGILPDLPVECVLNVLSA